MLATRDGFGEQLAECGNDNLNLFVLGADLSKATKCSIFKSRFPDRYLECGIAESNMVSIASGLSEHGYRVFISSFASFLTGRYDIIRCSLAYSEAPVVVVGSHGGMAIGRDGVTQMGLEDINLMRGLPGMDVLNPATATEAKAITKYLCETNRLSYLRVGRQPVEEVFDSSYRFEFGKGQVLRYGDGQIIVVSTGCVLPEVLKATNGLPITVVNMPTVKPIDRELLAELAWGAALVVTVEDHSIIGGLGSAVAEVLSESMPTKLMRIGLNDQFPESGAPEHLYEKYGLSAARLRETFTLLISAN